LTEPSEFQCIVNKKVIDKKQMILLQKFFITIHRRERRGHREK